MSMWLIYRQMEISGKTPSYLRSEDEYEMIHQNFSFPFLILTSRCVKQRRTWQTTQFLNESYHDLLIFFTFLIVNNFVYWV